MAGIYLDTSALGRVLLAEPDAAEIRSALDQYDDWWSSDLLVVELRRFATREGLSEPAEKLLAAIDRLGVDAAGLERASRVDPSEVRSLDAIHLDAAIQLQRQGKITAVLTYDRQLQIGCVHHGLEVVAPVPSD